MDLPCWLTKKQLYIAQQLISNGFHYCGNANDYCEPNYSIPVVDGWKISFPPGEGFIDCNCCDALFTKNLEATNINFEAELKLVKKLIQVASKTWDRTGIIYRQLALF